MFLTPELLIQAYTKGYFPMADPEEGNELYWHNPDLRAIIPLDHRFKASKNLRRLYRNGNFEYYINRNFAEVINACAQRAEDTWISEEIIESYIALHQSGFAHSFEVYQEGKLVGGLYGVAIGKAFFGESMFHRVTDCSKLALLFLIEFLNEQEFLLLDSQYINPHIASFGAYEVSRETYLEMLQEALNS